MQIPVINRSKHPLPEYKTAHAAAIDITASLDEPVTLGSLQRATIPTGLYMAIPAGYELQIRPRSGLAANHGLSIMNAPGTIDADYRGELMIILVNLSPDPYTVQDGDRIAQAVIGPCERIEWQLTDQLDDTERGSGRFGSTGR
ncbi:dUTP diphosphatase [Candidatus Saccharibacteria bacterium]|nr:dUTP diphosphatase [Candidatus Saccharibacteria bacterium]